MRNTALCLIIILLLSCDSLSVNSAENTAPDFPTTVAPASRSENAEVLAAPFELNTAAACLFSQMAYCPQPQEKLDSFLPGWKITWYPASANSNHAWVARNGNQWAVVFRGSLMEVSWHAFDNWINQDLNIITQVKWPFGKSNDARISQGAQNSFNNLLALKDSATGHTLAHYLLENLPGYNSQVLFTGHSLGGSLATVFASYFYHQWTQKKKESFPNTKAILFGSPAPGNESFANEFDQHFPQVTRVETTGDLVARFPCVNRIDDFIKDCAPLPATKQIQVSYRGMEVTLERALEVASLSLSLLEMKNGGRFKAVGGKVSLLKIEPGTAFDQEVTVQSWFSEAGLQHGIAQYAKALKVPVLICP